MAAIIVVILVIVMVGIVIKNLFYDGSRSRRTIGNEQQNKVKSQKKENKPVRKQDGPNIASKAKTKKSCVVGDTAAVLAGAALAHQAIKHHHHDNTRDLTSEHDDFYDADLDDWYDLDAEESIDYDDDVQYYDNTNYEDIGYYDDVEAYDDY